MIHHSRQHFVTLAIVQGSSSGHPHSARLMCCSVEFFVAGRYSSVLRHTQGIRLRVLCTKPIRSLQRRYAKWCTLRQAGLSSLHLILLALQVAQPVRVFACDLLGIFPLIRAGHSGTTSSMLGGNVEWRLAILGSNPPKRMPEK